VQIKRLSLKIPKSGEGGKITFQTTEKDGLVVAVRTTEIASSSHELFQMNGMLFQPSATGEGRKRGNSPGWCLECAAWTKAAGRAQMPAVSSGIIFHSLLSQLPTGE
jgi:hypothetical protein